MKTELTNPEIYNSPDPSAPGASPSCREIGKDAGHDRSTGDKAGTRVERVTAGVDGLSPTFYMDWLADAHKSCPRLGIATMLSVTSKIGDSARSFGLPLKETCCNGSGVATSCRHHCYVHKTREGRDGIEKRYEKNFEIAQRPDFDKLMTGAIRKSGIRHIKLHVSGDFFSTVYILAWLIIARRLRNVTFWIYTRAWRVDEFVPHLTDLSRLPNVQMFFSHDTTSGEPPVIEGVKRAFLSYYDEPSPIPSDLVFRASLERRSWIKTEIGGVFVCPHQSGKEKFPPDCVSCGYCLPNRKDSR